MSKGLVATDAPGPVACPACGASAQQRVAELEEQVKLLSAKASAAVDRLADYEDELRRLRALRAGSPAAPTLNPSADGPRPHTANPEGAVSRASRFSSLLTRRKSISNLSATPSSDVPPLPPAPPHRSDDELRHALEKEKALRRDAEVKLSAMSGEVEDLSVTLFQQANEMVADERRARAKLEERVEILEKRDEEKRGRLERLESAVQRIERVRGLLAS